MVRLFSAAVVFALSGLAAAAPLRISKRAFQPQDYADFQISDGVAGNAAAEARAVFVDPFAGTDLAGVDAATLDALKTMREAAEDAETALFNPAIDAAAGAEKDALQNGKTKNKVLKLTGFVQVLDIQIAQAKAAGEDSSDLEEKRTEEQTKLTKNIATDKEAAGEPSKGVTGGAPANDNAAAAAPPASATASASSTAASATASAASGASFKFTVRDYADFQISDGVAGSALAEANAVFVDPFAGIDLGTLDASVASDVETMRRAAEDAETDLFNPAIDAASGAAKDALQNGKTKNKVLKLVGITQVANIKIAIAKAKGEDTADLEEKLAEEQTKLDKNVATDKEHAGEASQGVV